MKRTIVTPLSKFPTEVILHFYRKNRLCHTDRHKYFAHYNWNKKCEEFWIPFYGPFEKDGNVYNIITADDKYILKICGIIYI